MRSAPLLLRTCLAVPGALPSILISLLQTVLALHLALALYLPAGMCMVAVFSVVFAGENSGHPGFSLVSAMMPSELLIKL